MLSFQACMPAAAYISYRPRQAAAAVGPCAFIHCKCLTMCSRRAAGAPVPVATHTIRRCMWSSGSSCGQEASEAGEEVKQHMVVCIYQRGRFPACRPPNQQQPARTAAAGGSARSPERPVSGLPAPKSAATSAHSSYRWLRLIGSPWLCRWGPSSEWYRQP